MLRKSHRQLCSNNHISSTSRHRLSVTIRVPVATNDGGPSPLLQSTTFPVPEQQQQPQSQSPSSSSAVPSSSSHTGARSPSVLRRLSPYALWSRDVSSPGSAEGYCLRPLEQAQQRVAPSCFPDQGDLEKVAFCWCSAVVTAQQQPAGPQAHSATAAAAAGLVADVEASLEHDRAVATLLRRRYDRLAQTTSSEPNNNTQERHTSFIGSLCSRWDDIAQAVFQSSTAVSTSNNNNSGGWQATFLLSEHEARVVRELAIRVEAAPLFSSEEATILTRITHDALLPLVVLMSVRTRHQRGSLSDHLNDVSSHHQPHPNVGVSEGSPFLLSVPLLEQLAAKRSSSSLQRPDGPLTPHGDQQRHNATELRNPASSSSHGAILSSAAAPALRKLSDLAILAGSLSLAPKACFQLVLLTLEECLKEIRVLESESETTAASHHHHSSANNSSVSTSSYSTTTLLMEYWWECVVQCLQCIKKLLSEPSCRSMLLREVDEVPESGGLKKTIHLSMSFEQLFQDLSAVLLRVPSVASVPPYLLARHSDFSRLRNDVWDRLLAMSCEKGVLWTTAEERRLLLRLATVYRQSFVSNASAADPSVADETENPLEEDDTFRRALLEAIRGHVLSLAQRSTPADCVETLRDAKLLSASYEGLPLALSVTIPLLQPRLPTLPFGPPASPTAGNRLTDASSSSAAATAEYLESSLEETPSSSSQSSSSSSPTSTPTALNVEAVAEQVIVAALSSLLAELQSHIYSGRIPNQPPITISVTPAAMADRKFLDSVAELGTWLFQGHNHANGSLKKEMGLGSVGHGEGLDETAFSSAAGAPHVRDSPNSINNHLKEETAGEMLQQDFLDALNGGPLQFCKFVWKSAQRLRNEFRQDHHDSSSTTSESEADAVKTPNTKDEPKVSPSSSATHPPTFSVIHIPIKLKVSFLRSLEALVDRRQQYEAIHRHSGPPLPPLQNERLAYFVERLVDVPNPHDAYRRKLFLLANIVPSSTASSGSSAASSASSSSPTTPTLGELERLTAAISVNFLPFASTRIFEEVVERSSGNNERFTHLMRAAVAQQFPASNSARSRVAMTLSLMRLIRQQRHKITAAEYAELRRSCLISLPLAYALNSWTTLVWWTLLCTLFSLQMIGYSTESTLAVAHCANKFFPMEIPDDDTRDEDVPSDLDTADRLASENAPQLSLLRELCHDELSCPTDLVTIVDLSNVQDSRDQQRLRGFVDSLVASQAAMPVLLRAPRRRYDGSTADSFSSKHSLVTVDAKEWIDQIRQEIVQRIRFQTLSVASPWSRFAIQIFPISHRTAQRRSLHSVIYEGKSQATPVLFVLHVPRHVSLTVELLRSLQEEFARPYASKLVLVVSSKTQVDRMERVVSSQRQQVETTMMQEQPSTNRSNTTSSSSGTARLVQTVFSHSHVAHPPLQHGESEEDDDDDVFLRELMVRLVTLVSSRPTAAAIAATVDVSPSPTQPVPSSGLPYQLWQTQLCEAWERLKEDARARAFVDKSLNAALRDSHVSPLRNNRSLSWAEHLENLRRTSIVDVSSFPSITHLARDALLESSSALQELIVHYQNKL